MDKTELDNHRITEKDLADIIIDNEMLKEAEEIEKSVENVEVPYREGDEERELERLLERIELEKAKRKNNSKIEEFTKSADEYGKKRRKKIRTVTRAAAAIVVLSIGIFGVSMTSEANRLRVMEMLDKTFRTESQIQIDNGTNRQYSDNDEQIASNEICSQLHIEVPKFYYIPSDMTFESYNIDPDAANAYMLYKYGDENLILYISTNEQDKSVTNATDDSGELIDTIKMNIKGENVEINLWNSKKDGIRIITWKYHNTYYEFGGKISDEEIRKIMEYILF